MSDTPMFPNWFDGQKYNFEQHLMHLAGQPNLRFLQVGAYTGDATVWLLDNVLTDQSSTLTDIDTWEGSDEKEHHAMDFNKVYEYYTSRTSKYPNLNAIRGKSKDVLPKLEPGFDFIYVDGDHTESAVYWDAIDSWELLAEGGIIAFDDYLWGQDVHPTLRPQGAIDQFMAEKQGEYLQLVDSYQVWLSKRMTK